MQTIWDDLRYLLAIQRGETVRAAARQLRVDDTTVSRRLASVERALGQKLVQRLGDRRLALTQAGRRVAEEVAGMERHYQSIAATIAGESDACAGTVRLTTVPVLANRLFACRFGGLAARYPSLVVELIPDSRDFNLTRREADIAVRLARPSAGGLAVKASRIGDLAYAAYAARDMPARRVGALPWVTYEDAMSHLPHARWMERAAQDLKAGRSSLRVHDADTAWEAVAAGLGKTLLPVLAADGDPRLRRVDVTGDRPLPGREVWLLAHADQAALPRVAAVSRWVRETMARDD